MKKVIIDINNKNQVYNFLQKKLLQNTTFKGKLFYKIIIKIYNKYPKFTKNLINNLHEITNYKSYFYILQYSKDDSNKINKQINTHIYNIIGKKYLEDIKYFRNKQYDKISMLAKWLPRKNKKFDRSYNFVKKFTKQVYPNIDTQPADKIYRKTVSDICKNFGILERDLCAKNLDNINYDKLTFRNFVGNYKKLWELPDKMEQYIIKRNNKLRYLIKRVLFIINNKDKNKYERELIILNKLWEEKYKFLLEKYKKKLPFDDILVVDLSSRVYNELKWQLMSIYLLSIYQNNYVIINKKNPMKIIKQDSLDKNITQLMINISTSDKFDFNKLENIEEKRKFILTDKNIDDKNNIIFKLEDSKLVNFKNKYTGNPFYFTNNERKEKINKIINYGELVTNNYNYIILGLILLFLTFYCVY
jgi:hypothetical protein